MTADRIMTVQMSELCDLPAYCRTVSARQAELVSKSIKPGELGNIPPVRARILDGKIYPITDFELIAGLKLRGVGSVTALVRDCESEADLLADHMEHNLQPQAVDPIKAYGMVRYLVCNAGDKMGVDDACSVLWLHRRPDLINAARLEITDEAVGILSEMLDEISAKVCHVITPAYYLKQLAKVDPSAQADAAREIKSVTISKAVSDGRFLWTTDGDIEVTLGIYPRVKKSAPAEDRVASVGKKSDLGKKKGPVGKKPSKREVAKASKFIGEDPEIVYVPIDADHPDLLVNKKTGRVALAEDKGETYTITDDLGRVTHLIPHKVSEFLDMGAENNLDAFHIRNYSSIAKAAKMLAKSKDGDSRCSVISRGALPQR